MKDFMVTLGCIIAKNFSGDFNLPDGIRLEKNDKVIGWVPSSVFAANFQENGDLDFGHALHMLKRGYRVRRSGWNGKGMWLMAVPGTHKAVPPAETPYARIGLVEVDIMSHIDMFTADGNMQPGWLPSQADLFASDWEILER